MTDTDGNKLWYHSTIVAVNNEKGQLHHIMVTSMNITAQKQAEHALNMVLNSERKKAEDQLQRVFESS